MMKLYSTVLALLIAGNLLAASEGRRMQLHPTVAAMHLHFAKTHYNDAANRLRAQNKIDADFGEPSGLVPELYRDLIQGYQPFLDNNRDVEAKALQILDLFEQPVSEDEPEIKAAADAFDIAAADPDNVDLWANELELFSEALRLQAQRSPHTRGFDLCIKISDRIVANHGIDGTPEARLEIAAHQMAIPGRFNQRFTAMKENTATFQAFAAKAPEVFARLLAKEEAAKQVTSEK